MLTAVLIDDEVKGRNVLREKLTTYCPQVTIAGEASNGLQGIQVIDACKPDIVFLDIEMPLMNGFDMLRELKSQDFHLVFTTAYDQYAIQAIKYSAFDYLLKPVDIKELQTAVHRAENAALRDQTRARLNTLQDNLSGQFHSHKIVIPSMEGLLFFNLADILYLKAESNYSRIFFTQLAPLLTTRTLHDYEEMLPPHIFFRPHYSYLVNIHFIKRYIKGDGGQIEMSNGDYVDVSRGRKDEFLRIIR